MKKTIVTCVMAAAVSAIIPMVALGQCSYVATGSGVMGGLSATATFDVGSGSCPTQPASNTDARVFLNSNYALTLDSDYVVGAGGSITVSAGRLTVHSHLTVEADGLITVSNGGSIVVEDGGSLDISSRGTVVVNNGGTISGDYNLGVGDGSASQKVTNLRVFAPSSVTSGVMRVNKATIMVQGGASLTTTCNTILYNSDIVADGAMYVLGNLDLTPGGANNTICGAGNISVKGCVFGGNGAFNHLAQNCTNKIGVCALGSSTGVCNMGPVAGNNTNERSCDALVPTCPRPLPVELTLFTATPTDRQQVALHWETASEKNSQSFVVERSADGKVFRDNRTVEGAGTTQTRTIYRVVDEQPLPGTSYYRLRQVDFDKGSSYSPVRVVQLSTKPGQGLDVYPGPTAKEWVVSSQLPAELLGSTGAALQVFDALGRVQSITLTPAEQPGRWTLGLQSLPTGIYVVRLLTSAGSYSRRIAQ
ncbi:T9SS type A sorting domain-containing protein [Hymenobacter properus]|uniref:T9SS type A sorting domain-containing protein n=1 Tax=Hymenobacter properus TaxID=2791026 RepID=A0A931FLZ0_9BACT|nr:T9SS type A sorting domain-containing protein [Hymenobacter properus]MBF9141164.1 T9SS type A sorting domain-containing protein [Hymenobacter properus]MBR7719973.1 T9SS type A sorting domain-containing protein [Microvirga sp. SRT04]